MMPAVFGGLYLMIPAVLGGLYLMMHVVLGELYHKMPAALGELYHKMPAALGELYHKMPAAIGELYHKMPAALGELYHKMPAALGGLYHKMPLVCSSLKKNDVGSEKSKMSGELELHDALEMVERERARELDCEAVSAEDIQTMGCVKYVTQYLPDGMRKQAHRCAIPSAAADCVHDEELSNPSKESEQYDGAIPTAVHEELPNTSPESKQCHGGISPTVGHAFSILWLQFFQVQKYLDEVALHIQKIQEIGRIIYPDDEELIHRFEVHDCSKFSFEEVYGYVLKWTHKVEEIDCPEWKESLDHHLLTNDHHPEFFRGKPMEPVALIESAVDMLSWRLIKNRINKPVAEWLFDVEDRYLTRYVEEDRVKVRQLLTDWKLKQFDGLENLLQGMAN